MCGRYTFTKPADAMVNQFQMAISADAPVRYNIAPGQMVLIVRDRLTKSGPSWEAAEVKWGLVPSWAKDASIANKMINARGETLQEKPAFRYAYKHRRCLVPADGFYEWQTVGKMKIPFYIHMKKHAPFAFAGLWETWERAEGYLQTCTIITTSANSLLRPLHERMPVILPDHLYRDWLSHNTSPDTLNDMLLPYPDSRMDLYPVRDYVSNVKYEGPALIEPRPVEPDETIEEDQLRLF